MTALEPSIFFLLHGLHVLRGDDAFSRAFLSALSLQLDALPNLTPSIPISIAISITPDNPPKQRTIDEWASPAFGSAALSGRRFEH